MMPFPLGLPLLFRFQGCSKTEHIEIFIIGCILQVSKHVVFVDDVLFLRVIRCVKADPFKHFLHDGVKPAGADILVRLVDLKGLLGHSGDALAGELEADAFGLQ